MLVPLLLACAPSTAEELGAVYGVDPAEAVADIDTNLAALGALEVFEVYGLVNDESRSAHGCYSSGPCPGYHETDELEERERQAVRLAALTSVAEAAAEGASVASDREAVDENLARLDALEIVVVGAFVEAVPENDPTCYNLPCAEDEAAAEAANAARASTLARTADGAESL